MLRFNGVVHPDEVQQQLLALKGIGPWTASYIVMRAFCAGRMRFRKEDIAIRNNLGGVRSKGGGADVTGVALVAQLCGAAYLEEFDAGEAVAVFGLVLRL